MKVGKMSLGKMYGGQKVCRQNVGGQKEYRQNVGGQNVWRP